MKRHYGSFPMNSPPMEYLGDLTPSLYNQIYDVADRVKSAPSFTQVAGRVSLRLEYESTGDTSNPLLNLATTVSRNYLETVPFRGSVASLSVITDIEAFNDYVEKVGNIASMNWHNDFKLFNNGYYHPPKGSSRIIIPMEIGPLVATGHLQLINAIQVEPSINTANPDQAYALNLGPTVIGADGVLMKAVEDPDGAQIITVDPSCVYGVPDITVHKTNPAIMNGRPFFQLDLAAVG